MVADRFLAPGHCTGRRPQSRKDLLDHLAPGVSTALSWQNLLFCFIGVPLGTLVGACEPESDDVRDARAAPPLPKTDTAETGCDAISASVVA